jgi:hypothetical protein
VSLATFSQHLDKLLANEFGVTKSLAKIDMWWSYEFSDLVKALKLNLSLQQKDELLQLFRKYEKECKELDAQIQKRTTKLTI